MVLSHIKTGIQTIDERKCFPYIYHSILVGGTRQRIALVVFIAAK